MLRTKIHIGEVYTSATPSVVETILGSCVSVCLFDKQMKTGGMNHILLPGKADMRNFDGGARYGINAMEMLINKLMKLGARRKRLQAKIFGGAHIIQSLQKENSPGLKNIAFVEKFMEIEGIPIVSRDTGGVNGRRIHFYTHSGDVYLKTLPAFHFPTISWEEDHFKKKVQKEILTSFPDPQLFEDDNKSMKGTSK
jgi:chemotaxis protein CheD